MSSSLPLTYLKHTFVQHIPINGRKLFYVYKTAPFPILENAAHIPACMAGAIKAIGINSTGVE